jgi:hypothetical protein
LVRGFGIDEGPTISGLDFLVVDPDSCEIFSGLSWESRERVSIAVVLACPEADLEREFG